MRVTAFGFIATGIVLLAVAHLPSILWSNQGRSGVGEGVGDCGVVALALVCHTDNNPRSLEELRQLAHCTPEGTNLLDLREAAESLGYKAEGVRLGFDSLREHVSKPHHFAILHLKPNHFIAVLGASDESHLRTGGLGNLTSDSDWADLRELGWDGVALLLHLKPGEELLEMEPRLIDLGRISVNSFTEFSATIRNRCDREVVIEEISANCGCANLQVQQTSLKSGDSSKLTGEFRASSQTGTVRKRVTLIISHPRRQAFEVELRATVVHTLPVTPDRLVLTPDFLTNKPGTAEALIRNESDHSVLLWSSTSQGIVTLDLSKRELLPGETARLRLEPLKQ